MTRIISYLLLFFAINIVLNFVGSIHPFFRYAIYAGMLFYFFRSMRLRMPRSKAGSYTYQEPPRPKHNNQGNVIDVEFTERETSSGQ